MVDNDLNRISSIKDIELNNNNKNNSMSTSNSIIRSSIDPEACMPEKFMASIEKLLSRTSSSGRGKDLNPLMSIGAETNSKIEESGYNKIVQIYSGATDRYFTGIIGTKLNITNKLLGRGSYGNIHLAIDENGKQFAVKCCSIQSIGIPNILEASIMATMTHPYLNRAIRINASDKKLYITQELAICDLAHHTRKDKGKHKPTLDELRKWCFSLAHAVSALHSENIIHADIKASNVLLYADGSIRLTDFGLATKKWYPDQMFTFNVCTCTHRPLECLRRKPWNESLDIWSLGCTFYEIAYGELLFPYQGVLEEPDKLKDKDAKIRLRQRSINAIIDWATSGPNPPTSYEVIGMDQIPINHIPFELCEDYKKPEMAQFNDLMCQMLIVDPKQRPTIGTVLNHPFFKGFRAPLYLNIQRTINKITVNEQARATQYIHRNTADPIVQNLAMSLYCRCNDLYHLSEQIRAATCTWIASKIVTGRIPLSMESMRNKLLVTEREICHNLLFRLHQI